MAEKLSRAAAEKALQWNLGVVRTKKEVGVVFC